MANFVDHEALEAAQALCMLARDARLQSIDGNETEDDDCVITHAPSPTPSQQPTLQLTPARHPLPDERPATVQQPTTDDQPSPKQSPSHAAAEDDAHNANEYSPRALALQALLAATDGELWSRRTVADWLEEEYPELRDQEDKVTFRLHLGNALNRDVHTGMLEKCPAVKGEKYNQYRLLARARETATIIAWKTKRPPGPKFESQGEPFVRGPYSWKSLALQGLLAAPQPEGWMHAREVINYLATQYPHFLGYKRDSLVHSINMALPQCHALVERSMQFGRGGHVFWRLAPGARDEATRLAWTASATHYEPE